ncbi:MAG: homocysteine S-methyltransferase family protein [Atribacterota bacterium]|nr:homocysteine S-methyltransferase family protein [Atribacterota bacterium]MDD5637440.1 homocysteine S-methyltransferase family protein [Atribacterota bacterium]
MVDEKKIVARNDFLELLSQRIMVIDGAMGTMLQEYGLTAGECPEMWNITHPDIVKKIHTFYLEAGADIILTNSFGGNGLKLQKFGHKDKLQEFNQQAVKIARKAIDNYSKVHPAPLFIAGSVGPTGEILEPYGPVKNEEVYATYQEQIKVLASSGVDLIVLETFYNLDEIKIALKVVKENTSLPVFASMSFDESLKTIYGITPEKSIEVLFQEGTDGVGANCGSGPDVLYQVVSRMRTITDAPLLVEPNAGVPYMENNKVIYPATPHEMSEYAEKFIKLRVNIIGGCCGTTPEHIRAIAQKVKNSL